MGGDDFANASASLHDLALILGDGSFIFADSTIAGPPEPEPEPEPVPEPVPLTPEEERAHIQAAVHEYARVFPYVHGTPPTKPPGPFLALGSPFEQTLSPPEVLVWLSHCPFPEMAKDTENVRLCIRLMGWMGGQDADEQPTTMTSTTSSTGTSPAGENGNGNKRKATDDGRSETLTPTSDQPAHDSSMRELIDPGLFSDDDPHGQLHLDFSSIAEQPPATAAVNGAVAAPEHPQHTDHGGFVHSGDDLLHAFPLPDELNLPDDDGAPSAYPHPIDGDGQPSLLDQHDFAAAIAAASAEGPDGLNLVDSGGLAGAGVLLSNPIDPSQPPPPPPPPGPPAKPKPILRTGPRQKRTKPAEPVQHPCEFVDRTTGVRCGKIFIRTFDLKRHFETVHVPRSELSYSCDACAKRFSRADALVRVRPLFPLPKAGGAPFTLVRYRAYRSAALDARAASQVVLPPPAGTASSRRHA